VPAAELWFAPPSGCACTQTHAQEVPTRFQPALAAGPLTFAAPPAPGPLFTTPASGAPVGDLTALQFTAAVQQWLAGHGAIFSAGAPVVQGMPGSWSVSDGVTVLRLTVNGPDLIVTGRPPPAAAALPIDPRTGVPAISLIEQSSDLPWTARRDL